MPALEQLFESFEAGSAGQLRAFLKQAAYKYQVSMQDYVFRPSHSSQTREGDSNDSTNGHSSNR
jgi:hypothetical protein